MTLLLSRLTLAATGTAARCARTFVRHTLASWLLTDLVDDAELIVSELATNAVNATGTTDPHAVLEGSALLAVQARVSGESLFIEVWDQDSDCPAVSPPVERDPDEGGRGLVIVRALSVRYGVTHLPDHGKVVWAELRAGKGLAPGPRPESEPLPRAFGSIVLPGDRRSGPHAAADLALTRQMAHPLT